MAITDCRETDGNLDSSATDSVVVGRVVVSVLDEGNCSSGGGLPQRYVSFTLESLAFYSCRIECL